MITPCIVDHKLGQQIRCAPPWTTWKSRPCKRTLYMSVRTNISVTRRKKEIVGFLQRMLMFVVNMSLRHFERSNRDQTLLGLLSNWNFVLLMDLYYKTICSNWHTAFYYIFMCVLSNYKVAQGKYNIQRFLWDSNPRRFRQTELRYSRHSALKIQENSIENMCSNVFLHYHKSTE